LQGKPDRWTPLIKKGYEDLVLPSVKDFKDYRISETELWPRGNKAVEMYKANLLGKVFKDAVNDPLIMNEEFVNHLKLDGREQYLPLIEEIISDPQEIWLQAEKEKMTGKVVFRKRYISFIALEKERRFMFVADSAKCQWLSYTFYPVERYSTLDNVRTGVLLHGK